MIQSENIGGVYVIPSHESPFGMSLKNMIHIFKTPFIEMRFFLFVLIVWFGVIFVRDGPYRDGVFRFNISLPKSFPNTEDAPVSSEVDD